MGQGNLAPDRDSWQLQGLLGHSIDTEIEIVERSREVEKMLTPAHNPIEKGLGEELYITSRQSRSRCS